MTSIQKYLIGASALIVFVFVSIIYIIHWDSHNVSTAISTRDAVWMDSLKSARDIRHVDTIYTPNPKQSTSFKNTHKPDTVRVPVPDSLAFATMEEYFEDLYQYIGTPLDTTVVFGKDSVHAAYDPLSHIGTIGLILAPTPEIIRSDSLLVGEPCKPVPYYDSRGAWFGYGAVAVLVVIEAFHLITN